MLVSGISETRLPRDSQRHVRPGIRVASQEPRARGSNPHLLHVQRGLAVPGRTRPPATGRHGHARAGLAARQPARGVDGLALGAHEESGAGGGQCAADSVRQHMGACVDDGLWYWRQGGVPGEVVGSHRLASRG